MEKKELFIALLIDDDEQFCRLLGQVTEHHFFQSNFPDYDIRVRAYSKIAKPQEVIRWVEENRPDLVMLDYMLGLEPGACITALEILEGILFYCRDIVVISGLSAEDIRLILARKGLGEVGISVLQKPFGIEDIVQIFRTSIQKKELGHGH